MTKLEMLEMELDLVKRINETARDWEYNHEVGIETLRKVTYEVGKRLEWEVEKERKAHAE